MDLINKFGELVGNTSMKDADKARKLLLLGYRLQEKRLCLFPDKRLPKSGRYVARVVMQSVIDALSKPEAAVLVSIFVPGELLTAAGLTPYSVEAMSCFLAGTQCEQPLLRKTEEEGFPETMCSYHRVFLGASLAGLVPAPKCMVYTNLACDGNMMTFPYLKQKQELSGFYIDVPYEKNEDSIQYVAEQLRELKKYLEDMTGKPITEDAVTTLTNEVYALFMCHLMAGTKESVEYTRLLLEDVKQAKKGEGPHVLWMHMMPFLQAPVKELFNYNGQMHIRTCDFVADGFQRAHHEDPYEAMAEKMVNCIYNGSVTLRIEKAKELARLTDADGSILFAHWGCKGTIGASTLIKRELENDGIPTMVLDGDGCNPANTSDGQVSTRLQAFMEMLKEELVK